MFLDSGRVPLLHRGASQGVPHCGPQGGSQGEAWRGSQGGPQGGAQGSNRENVAQQSRANNGNRDSVSALSAWPIRGLDNPDSATRWQNPPWQCHHLPAPKGETLRDLHDTVAGSELNPDPSSHPSRSDHMKQLIFLRGAKWAT